MTTPPSELVALASKLLAEDDDHMVATGDELDWLIAQIVAWPTRVHPDHTTNDRFLRFSAAATLRSLLATVTELEGRVKTAEGVNAKLVADLAKFDAEASCEGCQAPLLDGDDFVTDPEDGCSGCWAAMTDLPSKRERPCYAYRVGKPSAGSKVGETAEGIAQKWRIAAGLSVDPPSEEITPDVDDLTGCADDQTFADCDPDALRDAAAQWLAGKGDGS